MLQKKIFFLFCLALGALTLNAQTVNTRTINGTITEALTGEPILGATVMLKGTTIGAVSDLDGKYQITIPSGRQTLTFNFIGFKTQECVVESSASMLNVALEEDYMALEEVVVTGYATVAKKSVSASMSSVRASDVASSSSKKKGSTWQRSGLPENSIRLEVGDNEYIALQAAQVAVKIDGFRVRVLMDCFFFNDKKDGLEGNFKLRLPAGATPYYFAFGETEYLDEDDFDEDDYDDRIDNEKRTIKPYGKKIPYVTYGTDNFDLSPDNIEYMDGREWDRVKSARIASKQKAALAYESTVSARIDPALMEWAGADMFSCRVFPLSHGKLHRVVIGYDLNMIEALDFREYVLTLPSAKELQVDIDMYAPLNMVPSISPNVESTQEEDRKYVHLENPKRKEYTIQYNTVEPIMLVEEDEEYFAANYRINLPETRQSKLPGDAVFLFDLSLSSQPDKFNVWLKLTTEILSKNRDVIHRFAVLCFNVETFWWKSYYLSNNEENLEEFLQFANTLALEGATDFGSALSEASNPSWQKKNGAKHIFVMSDGDFNWGEGNLQALQRLINKGDRVHTYKTGLSGTNANVLDHLSRETNGFSFTVTGEEEAELTAKSFRYRPWLIEDIKVEGVEDFLIYGYPTQLYNGQKLIFSGRGVPTGEVQIRVNNGWEVKELKLSAKQQLTSTLTKRLYGQAALSYLENFGYQAEEATESYATYFLAPNSTMSFVMLENEYDYDDICVDEYDARRFVEDNTVEQILKDLLENGGASFIGNGKSDFITWFNRLTKDPEIGFTPDDAFVGYLNSLPDDAFNVKLASLRYRIREMSQQSEDEQAMLGGDNIRYDDLLNLALQRKKRFGNGDALKLLSSVIEKNPGDFMALRDIAIKATEWGMGDQSYYMMRRIITNRQYEAVAYLTAADALASSGHFDLAMVYYYICLSADWDSDYGSFKEISALQCMRLLNKIQASSESDTSKKQPKPSRQAVVYASRWLKDIESFLDKEDLLVKEADIVVIMNWNTNNTDIDLHVFEPTGEECYYGHQETKIGGQLTIDVTDGYGPEMYVLRNAVNGKYRVMLECYSDNDTRTSSKSKVYVDFYHNWGRADEKHSRKTIVLDKRRDREDVLQFEVKKVIQSLQIE